ncbi:MAG: hypothetical protein ACYDH1_15950 [Anaerolineaceae bacterium]
MPLKKFPLRRVSSAGGHPRENLSQCEEFYICAGQPFPQPIHQPISECLQESVGLFRVDPLGWFFLDVGQPVPQPISESLQESVGRFQVGSLSWPIPGRSLGLADSGSVPVFDPFQVPANMFTNQYQKVSWNQLTDSRSIPWVG